MNKNAKILILLLIFSTSACKDKKTDEKSSEISRRTSTDLHIDHFNIWVENPQKAKEQLTNIGFTAVPDSLSQIHKGQGTTGRYFYFLNGYLELIFIYDQNKFDQNNTKNKKLDFEERVNFKKNGASPFSIALKIEDYDLEKIPFQVVRYQQDWMSKNTAIYSAKNSKINLNEPSIFVVSPEMESDRFETFSDLKNIPEEYALWRTFFKHPNGAQKITNLIISSSNLNLNTATVKTLNAIENLTIKKGKEHLMELHFDNDVQRKSFDLRPELPLIIYL